MNYIVSVCTRISLNLFFPENLCLTVFGPPTAHTATGQPGCAKQHTCTLFPIVDSGVRMHRRGNAPTVIGLQVLISRSGPEKCTSKCDLNTRYTEFCSFLLAKKYSIVPNPSCFGDGQACLKILNGSHWSKMQNVSLMVMTPGINKLILHVTINYKYVCMQ